MFGKMEYKSSRSSMGSWFSSRSMSRFISQLIELREGDISWGNLAWNSHPQSTPPRTWQDVSPIHPQLAYRMLPTGFANCQSQSAQSTLTSLGWFSNGETLSVFPVPLKHIVVSHGGMAQTTPTVARTLSDELLSWMLVFCRSNDWRYSRP